MKSTITHVKALKLSTRDMPWFPYQSPFEPKKPRKKEKVAWPVLNPVEQRNKYLKKHDLRAGRRFIDGRVNPPRFGTITRITEGCMVELRFEQPFGGKDLWLVDASKENILPHYRELSEIKEEYSEAIGKELLYGKNHHKYTVAPQLLLNKNNVSDADKFAAISGCAEIIKLIPVSPKLRKALIWQNPHVIFHLDNISEEEVLAAQISSNLNVNARLDPISLYQISYTNQVKLLGLKPHVVYHPSIQQTEEIQLLAVKNYTQNIGAIEKPTLKTIDYVLEQRPFDLVDANVSDDVKRKAFDLLSFDQNNYERRNFLERWGQRNKKLKPEILEHLLAVEPSTIFYFKLDKIKLLEVLTKEPPHDNIKYTVMVNDFLSNMDYNMKTCEYLWDNRKLIHKHFQNIFGNIPAAYSKLQIKMIKEGLPVSKINSINAKTQRYLLKNRLCHATDIQSPSSETCDAIDLQLKMTDIIEK